MKRVLGRAVEARTRQLSALACAVAALLAIVGMGCGASGGASSSPSAGGSSASAGGNAATGSDGSVSSKALRHDGDEDDDSHGMGQADPDNDAIPAYGPAAGPADRAAIVAVITRYYAAAAAGDGAKACSLTYGLFAEALVEEHRGRGASTRGDTCRQILAKVFADRHRELVKDLAALRITFVQLRGRQGWAVLRFGALNERLAHLQRLGSGWRMDAVLDAGAL